MDGERIPIPFLGVEHEAVLRLALAVEIEMDANVVVKR